MLVVACGLLLAGIAGFCRFRLVLGQGCQFCGRPGCIVVRTESALYLVLRVLAVWLFLLVCRIRVCCAGCVARAQIAVGFSLHIRYVCGIWF
jgi:hypothetical protein